jgi:hypothetical protein
MFLIRKTSRADNEVFCHYFRGLCSKKKQNLTTYTNLVKMRTNSSKSRLSYKNSLKQRKTQFKKCHKVWNKSLKSDKNEINEPGPSHEQDLPNYAEPVVRLEASVAEDVCNAQLGYSTLYNSPVKLRPKKRKESSKDVNEPQHVGENENIIVNFKQLESLFQKFAAHTCDNPNIKLTLEDRQGLCVSLKVKCSNCKFITDTSKLFNSIKSTRGPDAGCLNSALLLPVLLSKVGINDILLMLSALNIQAPNKRGLQKKLHTLSDKIENLGKEQMIQNQHYVKKIQSLSGTSGTDVEFDVAYTSRPQSGCETSSQSFAPIIEQTTSRHLPIYLSTANKLCLKQKCNHNNRNCKKSYSTEDSIASTEAVFIKSAIESVESSKILKIRSVTTDASLQIAKSLREINSERNSKINHYKCFVHNLRNMNKHLKAIKFNKIPPGQNKKYFASKLASSIRVRVRLELTRLKNCSKTYEEFLQKAQVSIENILPCFKGLHINCRRDSVVCKSHLKCFKLSYLPYGKYLKLPDSDISKIKSIISKYCGPAMIKDISQLKTTNQCESFHNRVFSHVPKNTVWSRNFSGLCHSATIRASIGRGSTLLKIAQNLGLPVSDHDPIQRYALDTDKNDKYHMNRKKSFKYKTFLHLKRKRNSNRSIISQSAYSDATDLTEEHPYALNPN